MNLSILSQCLLLIFPVFLITGAIFDILTLRLPNPFNLFGLILFFPIALLAGLSLEGVLIHLLVGLGVLLISFSAYAAGFFGAGDSKFMTVIALWIGYEPLAGFLLYTGILGGLMALVILIAGRLIPFQFQPPFFKAMTKKNVVPYGTAMAIAALLVYHETPIWLLMMS